MTSPLVHGATLGTTQPPPELVETWLADAVDEAPLTPPVTGLVIDRLAGAPGLGGPIEPKKEDVVLCTYPDTLDGRLAAWVVRRVAKTHNIPVEFSTKDPEEPLEGRNWIAFGSDGIALGSFKSGLFFVPKTLVETPSPHWNKPIPFRQWKRTFPFGVEALSSEQTSVVYAEKSLALAAWDFFYADRLAFDKRPRLLEYVNDAVTETFGFADTKAVVACVETYDKAFQTLDKLVEACDDRKRLAFIVTSGQAVLRYIDQNTGQAG